MKLDIQPDTRYKKARYLAGWISGTTLRELTSHLHVHAGLHYRSYPFATCLCRIVFSGSPSLCLKASKSSSEHDCHHVKPYQEIKTNILMIIEDCVNRYLESLIPPTPPHMPPMLQNIFLFICWL